MNTTLSIILFALFVALVSYFIGLQRGNETHKYDYDDGYENGWNNCIDEIEFVKRGGESEIITNPELIFGTGWDETREQKARELVHQLDALFDGPDDEDYDDDDSQNNNIIDCGSY